MKTPRDRKPGPRPFPWTCPQCLKDEVVPTTIAYTSSVKHDGVVYSVHVPDLCTPRCQACGELLFTEHADEQINGALRRQLRLLTPAQILKNRTELNLSQQELAARLGVAKETISRWENCALIQSRAMDNLLRLYFGLTLVREVLTGPGQDPEFGAQLITESKKDCRNPVSTQVGQPEEQTLPINRVRRYTLAAKVYGEAELAQEASRVRAAGSLFLFGRG